MASQTNAFVDMRLLGDNALIKQLRRLSLAASRKIVSPALTKVAKQFAKDSTAAMPADTGMLKSIGMQVVPATRRRGTIGKYVQTPGREELDLPQWSKDGPGKWYYPTHVELGHGEVAPRPFIRGTMKTKRKDYVRMLSNLLKKRILRLAGRAG